MVPSRIHRLQKTLTRLLPLSASANCCLTHTHALIHGHGHTRRWPVPLLPSRHTPIPSPNPLPATLAVTNRGLSRRAECSVTANRIGRWPSGMPRILTIVMKGDICHFICVCVCACVCVRQGLSAGVTQIGLSVDCEIRCDALFCFVFSLPDE